MLKKLLFIFLFFIILVEHAWAWTISDAPVSYGEYVTTNNYGQIVVDSNGNVYVATGSVGVRKYDSSGSLLTTFGPNNVFGVTIDNDGNILVADTNSTIGSVPGVRKYDSSGNSIDISGTALGGTGYFAFAYGIDTDSSGNVYVSDITNNEVYKFNSSGTYVATITGNGSNFASPQMVAVDNADNLYVLDSNNDRVQKFDSNGNFLSEVTNLTTGNYPESFTVDADGNMYVADSDKIRILMFQELWFKILMKQILVLQMVLLILSELDLVSQASYMLVITIIKFLKQTLIVLRLLFLRQVYQGMKLQILRQFLLVQLLIVYQ